MVENTGGSLTPPHPITKTVSAPESLAHRRADIVRTRGRLSLALESVEARARSPLSASSRSSAAAGVGHGLAELLAASVALTAQVRQFRQILPASVAGGVLMVTAGALAALTLSRTRASAASNTSCPHCGELLTELAESGAYRCLRCGWLGDMEDARTARPEHGPAVGNDRSPDTTDSW